MTDPPLETPGAAGQGDRAPAGEARSFPIVGIGASAGGLDAFTRLLQALPVDTGMAFVLVQHLAPWHPSALAEILSRATKMPVLEVAAETKVEADRVYVIPPDRSMILAGGVLQLLPREGGALHRPVDQFFHSLADDRRHQAIGVVLSGTATDGTLGLEAIKGAGGITFAQDATAQHEGMPRSAIAAGWVDFVLPPEAIARDLVRIGCHPYAAPGVHGPDDKADLGEVVQILHRATGVDFTHYKRNTLYRRITRRMVLQDHNDLGQYVQFLQRTPAEVKALFADILICVTSFFRDPESFAALQSLVFPRLLQGRSQSDPVRIWTLGCSTGQEAYSLAMAFTEAAEAADSHVPLQLFATDLNPASIDKARAGLYGKDIADDVSPERLRRFFTETDSGYRIDKSIRDACAFSQHNVLTDPPFSRIDLISCRNMLIYLEPVLQQRIVPTLHYALKPHGCLWLGGSETIGSHRHLFEAEDGKHRIYTRKPGAGPGRPLFAPQHGGALRAPFTPNAGRTGAAADPHKEADRILLNRFAPPGVVVSADLEILQYRGDTSAFLAPAPGKASFSLLKMLREGLLVAVRQAVLRAGKQNAPVREAGLRVKSNGGYREAAIEVIPLKRGGAKDGGFLILFEEPTAYRIDVAPGRDVVATAAGPSATPPGTPDLVADIARLEQELLAAREYLQSLIEEQEAANEELQSANEEVQSANEELQSTNEELETSKEEIQSSNEELATVNDELNNRNADLNQLNNDLVHLLGNIQTAIVMLGPDLRIRRFTPAAASLLGLVPSDIGRPLTDVRLDLDDLPDLRPLLAEVLATVGSREAEVQDENGRWYSLRLRSYKTPDGKIDGVVVMLVDVDTMKRVHAYTESIVATVREPLLVLDQDLRVKTASRSFYETFRTTSADTVGRLLYELGNNQWDIADLRRLLEEVLPRDNQVDDFEMEHEFEQIGQKTMRVSARRLLQASDHAPLILLAIEDVTERRRVEKQGLDALAYADNILATLREPFLVLDQELRVVTANRSFYQNFHVAPAETQGRFVHDLGNRQWDIPKLRTLLDEVLRQDRAFHDFEVEHDFSSVGRRVMLLNARRIRQPGREAELILLAIEDVTARRHLEKQLREQAAVLSDLHRRKDEFLAMLSHELRNPLASITSAVDLLGLQRSSENQTQQQARGIIERQIGQLQHLVDDLLEVSRITTGRLQLRRERVAVGDLVTRAVETVRPMLEQRRHSLTVSMPPEPVWLHADAARLEQVIVNLLTNAVKFTENGGRIWLTFRQEGDEHVLRVRDTGVGIAPELLPRIFDLFTQEERSLDRAQGGLGIGLALVQRLTELHGGRVEAFSTLGEGSEFVLRLPIVLTEAPPLPTPGAATARPTPRLLRVLVVDDNVDAVLGFSMLLKAMGHDVRTAPDGLAAVETALDYRPDVVLLDIGLPGLNGYEVAKRIRLEATLDGVVLVAMTGYGQESDRRASLAAGFDHHLVKPAGSARLEKLLAAVPLLAT